MRLAASDASVAVKSRAVNWVFNKLDAFTALLFTATGAPPPAKRTRILPLTQHSDNIWNEEILPFLTDGVENAVPLHVALKYSEPCHATLEQMAHGAGTVYC
jgi:hypothetical protein